MVEIHHVKHPADDRRRSTFFSFLWPGECVTTADQSCLTLELPGRLGNFLDAFAPPPSATSSFSRRLAFRIVLNSSADDDLIDALAPAVVDDDDAPQHGIDNDDVAAVPPPPIGCGGLAVFVHDDDCPTKEPTDTMEKDPCLGCFRRRTLPSSRVDDADEKSDGCLWWWWCCCCCFSGTRGETARCCCCCCCC